MGALRAYRQVLANPRLARLMVGEFVSSIGDWLYLVALLIVVYDVSRDPVVLGLVGAGRIVPFLLLAIPAGIAADRFDRRAILVVTDVIRLVLQLVLAALVLVSAPTLAIVAVSIIATCASAFFGPAIGAYLPSLVDDEADLGPANSLWATLDNLAYFIGPAVAGILIAAGGLVVAFLLNALSFAIVAAVLWTLPGWQPDAMVADKTGTVGDSSNQPFAWRSIIGRIPGNVVLDGATSFSAGALGVLTVVIAFDALGAGEEGTGYLNAATGIGGILGGILAGTLVVRRLDIPLIGATLVGLAGVAVLAFTRDLWPAMIAIGIVTGALLLLDVIDDTVLQRAIPDAERGRALGFLQVSSSVLMIAGAFLGPILAAQFGLTTALLATATITTLIALAALVLMRPSGALKAVPIPARRVDLLRGSPFGSLQPARIESAARALVPIRVRAGERVIEQGAEADRFYFVDRGQFRVTQQAPDGGEATLKTLGPGDVFGEIGLLTSAPRTASVTAETDGQLFALDREAFHELVSAGPGLSSRLLDLHRGSVTTAARA